jgi:hypothetical protein
MLYKVALDPIMLYNLDKHSLNTSLLHVNYNLMSKSGPVSSQKPIHVNYNLMLKLDKHSLNTILFLVSNQNLDKFCQCYLHQQTIGWSRSCIPVLRWLCEL